MTECLDDLGNVESGSKKGGSAAGASVAIMDTRVTVHPQSFLDVALGKSSLR